MTAEKCPNLDSINSEEPFSITMTQDKMEEIF
jgi:hypothetical protein